MLIGPSWEPNLLPYWAPNLGPSRPHVCPNFALTAAKFLFSNSGNFRAKANPPKPRSCPKKALSGNEWGKIPVLTGQPLFPLGNDYFHQNNIDLHVEIIHC